MKFTLAVLVSFLCRAALAADAPDGKEKKPEVMVALYVGVDGVCFSTSGAKLEKYKAYLERETAVKLSDAELKALIDALKKAGFESEEDRTIGGFGGIPPQTFDILVASDGGTKEVRFYYQTDSTVPEKYLKILEALPNTQRPESLMNFIWSSRENPKGVWLLNQMREGRYSQGTFPDFDWSDIPVLLDLASRTDALKTFPVNPASSAGKKTPTEGVMAMWLIEGIRKGKNWPSLNPICYKHTDNPDGTTSDCQQDMLDAYRKWWAKVKSMPENERSKFDPLDGSGLRWY